MSNSTLLDLVEQRLGGGLEEVKALNAVAAAASTVLKEYVVVVERLKGTTPAAAQALQSALLDLDRAKVRKT
jgi:hypothetical protein